MLFVTLDIMESHVYSLHLHVIFEVQKSRIYCWLISKPSDRHDLITRVFKCKLRKLIDLITKCKIFGKVIYWIYSIEWQKKRFTTFSYFNMVRKQSSTRSN